MTDAHLCVSYVALISSYEKDLLMLLSNHIQVINEPEDIHCAVEEISTRSKLSCLSWNKYAKNQIASSDYEGIVTVWDVNTRQVVKLPPLHNTVIYIHPIT